MEAREETVNVDLPAIVGASISRRLHDAGVSVTPAQSVEYLRVLQLSQPRSRRQLYAATCAIFLTDSEHLATLDRVFAEVFGGCALS